MKKRSKTLLTHLLLLILVIVILFPFYTMLVMSSRTSEELYRGVYYSFGSETKNNIIRVMTGAGFFRSYLNSIIVAAASVIGGSFVAASYGYGIAKYEFKLKGALTWFVLVLMMIPGQVSLIGFVMQMRAWKLTSSLWPLILSSLASPFCTYFMISFCKTSIPTEVLESARIDGASELKIFFQIAMPFMLPALAVIGILQFLWSWNNYMLPLITCDTVELRTLPLYIRSLTLEYLDDPAAKCTGVALTTIPIFIIYFMFSKTFISGIAAGAVKG